MRGQSQGDEGRLLDQADRASLRSDLSLSLPMCVCLFAPFCSIRLLWAASWRLKLDSASLAPSSAVLLLLLVGSRSLARSLALARVADDVPVCARFSGARAR